MQNHQSNINGEPSIKPSFPYEYFENYIQMEQKNPGEIDINAAPKRLVD